MLNDKGEEVGIIYGWYNTKSEKWYVGQTIDPEGRYNKHIKLSLNNDNTHFHRALRKYGLENFVYCVLEENVLRANLNMMEMDWIEELDSFYSGYNLTLGGGGTVSRICTEETRMKLSQSHKGQIPWNKGKLGWCEGPKNGMYGKHHTEESKRKMSEAHKNLPGQQGSKNGMYGKPAPNRRKVIKYDLNGNFIQEYDSIKKKKKNT